MARITPSDLIRRKMRGEKIPVITAYDFASAKIAEQAGVPVLLVGDSLGVVMLGHDTTLPVTLGDMIRHASAVVRGHSSALIICDLPFLTYADTQEAIRSAQRILQQTGAQALKLEGGMPIVPTVRHLVEHGVPIMGHLGFTPQSQHVLDVKVQAKDTAGAERLLAEALALEAAGAFALVLELVPADLSQQISQRLTIPTIGIGAGEHCDGQIQVWHDLLGLTAGKVPKHARCYAHIGALIQTALSHYVADITAGKPTS